MPETTSCCTSNCCSSSFTRLLPCSTCSTKIDEKLQSTFLQFDMARSKRIALICVLIVGSALLSLVSHFPSVLMAWATDPFYASRIVFFYGIIIFAYFLGFHYTYIVSSKTFSDMEKKLTKRLCFIVPTSLLMSFIAVSGVVVILTVYVISVPINNSIETATEGVTSIYNGAVVLIGGLVAYRIGWQYIGHSFSVSGALENALKKVKYPSQGDKKAEWEMLTEEGKLTKIMQAVINEEVEKKFSYGF